MKVYRNIGTKAVYLVGTVTEIKAVSKAVNGKTPRISNDKQICAACVHSGGFNRVTIVGSDKMLIMALSGRLTKSLIPSDYMRTGICPCTIFLASPTHAETTGTNTRTISKQSIISTLFSR